MPDRVRIDQLAAAVMEGLTEYADLAADELKKAVKKAGNSVKKDIQEGAPKDTGAYAKSWSVKNVKETSNSIELVVHSRNRYQLSHLLEFGPFFRRRDVRPSGATPSAAAGASPEEIGRAHV